MSTLKIKISNPNPYNSKNTGTAMVSYVVTGSKEAVEQFRKDQLAEGVSSSDDNGNPLIHFTAKAALKYGATSELERAETKDENIIWFADTEEEKQVSKLIAGADDTTKVLYAQEKLAEIRKFANTLANNRSKNIAKLLGKEAKEVKTSIAESADDIATL